ncbi:MAG: carboxy terminal-processing peptidase [Chitinophagaceae bacterium]
MSRKFIPVWLILIGAGLFLAIKTTMGRGEDNPKSKYEKILRNIGIILEEGHVKPKKIDDVFSKQVFENYLEDLDGDKTIFLQSDIDAIKKYEFKIDDEIHGVKLESYYEISKLYSKRLQEVADMYRAILATPFNFNVDENILLDGKKAFYPKNEKERLDANRKRIKYLVLSKYSDMLEEREKNKGKEGLISKTDTSLTGSNLNDPGKTKPREKFIYKADSTLEREARALILKQLDRFYTTLKNHNKPDDLFSDFVNAITTTMDPHTTYFAPVDMRSFNEELSGTFYGIGAQLKDEDGKIKVSSLVSGGPAWKSGNIQPEDEIIKIAQGNGEPVDVTGYAVSDAVKLIRGASKGSEVRLTLKKVDGSTKVVSLMRDEIRLEDKFAKSAIINSTNKIGYIYLPEFYVNFERPNAPKCSEDVAKEVEKLKAENVDGIIIDLRGNGGGSLYEVVRMAGLFIEDGPIVQVKGRDEKSNVLRDNDKNVLYTGPLAVMVDEMSASASEIFAAAIQDYKRGLIIGSTSTYGKGSVQRSISLDPEAENRLLNKLSPNEGLGDIKLTLQKYYRINGDATQLKGVVPDIILPDRLEYVKFREKDNPLSLNWDEINKADYKTWNPGYNVLNVVNEAKTQMNDAGPFSKIREHVQWLDKNLDKEYSLNLQKFTAKQKAIRSTFRQLDSLSNLQNDLTVVPVSRSKEEALDKDREEKLTQFLKRVSNDIYVDKTVKVLNNIIGEVSLAKASTK